MIFKHNKKTKKNRWIKLYQFGKPLYIKGESQHTKVTTTGISGINVFKEFNRKEQSWRDGLEYKSNGYSSRRPEFRSQQSHDGSQLSQ